MKHYIIKPEFLHLYGEDATPTTVLDEDDVREFANEFGKGEAELIDQLIEIRKTAWTPVNRFAGNPTWQELNKLIAFDSGVDDLHYCESEEDYKQAVKEGWITYDGYYTTVWRDDMGG